MPPSATPLMLRCAATLFPGDEEEGERFLAALLRTGPAPAGRTALDPQDSQGGGRARLPPLRAVVWLREPEPGAFETVPREQFPFELPPGVEVLVPGERAAGRAPFVRGDCYVLDLSSVLAASAMLRAAPEAGTGRPGPRILDLCASPGGKSILAARWLAPSLLLANEFVLKRLGPLRHNLKRCGVGHACTQSLPPESLAELAPGAFDLVLVDAPCSGQSLLAKGKENPGCFHPSTVKGNARRQARILEAAAAAARPGGYLLYTTCTFSLRENEELVRRFLKGRDDFEPVAAGSSERHLSPHAPFPCYRYYPHRNEGAGGFAALLRRQGERAGPPPELPQELLAYPV